MNGGVGGVSVEWVRLAKARRRKPKQMPGKLMPGKLMPGKLMPGPPSEPRGGTRVRNTGGYRGYRSADDLFG